MLNRHKQRTAEWKLHVAARTRRARDRRNGSPALSASTRCSRYRRRPIISGASVTFGPGGRTAWHTHPLGQTLVVTFGCGWLERQRAGRGNPPGRRGLVTARREALARCHGNDGHDAHRHSGITRRQGRRVDGACYRRTVSRRPGARLTTQQRHPARLSPQYAGAIRHGR